MERQSITLTDGVAASASSLSGLDVIRSLIDGRLDGAPMATMMDFKLLAAEVGQTSMRAVPHESFLNMHGTIHGGWAATLLDTALGCAVVTTLSAGQGAATVELSTRYIRPIFPDSGPVVVTGRVLNRGKKLVVAEGTIVSERDGKVVGQATGTWMVLER